MIHLHILISSRNFFKNSSHLSNKRSSVCLPSWCGECQVRRKTEFYQLQPRAKRKLWKKNHSADRKFFTAIQQNRFSARLTSRNEVAKNNRTPPSNDIVKCKRSLHKPFTFQALCFFRSWNSFKVYSTIYSKWKAIESFWYSFYLIFFNIWYFIFLFNIRSEVRIIKHQLSFIDVW